MLEKYGDWRGFRGCGQPRHHGEGQHHNQHLVSITPLYCPAYHTSKSIGSRALLWIKFQSLKKVWNFSTAFWNIIGLMNWDRAKERSWYALYCVPLCLSRVPCSKSISSRALLWIVFQILIGSKKIISLRWMLKLYRWMGTTGATYNCSVII